METTKNNKLIVDFMGWQFYNEKLGYFNEFSNELQPDFVKPEYMGFSSQWDWIMPVVEKIEQNGASVIIGRMFCEIKYTDPLNQLKEFQIRIASGVKINAVNGAVIEFIKWYNQK